MLGGVGRHGSKEGVIVIEVDRPRVPFVSSCGDPLGDKGVFINEI